jgi:peptidoglycan/xylan/chitin deacetylase (PgdA/CDA1 family)
VTLIDDALSGYGALTIDVDTLGCYHDIHGLPSPQPRDSDPIYTHALPRFLDICERLDVRATLFVIGQDLDNEAHRDILKDAADRGHEIASHSDRHDYALSTLAPDLIRFDLERAGEAIERAVGAPPVGFRAPGYNLSEPVFDALEALGYLYDSSLFPTPAYFALRAAAIGQYRLRGRPSQSLVGDAREFAARRAPFIPARGARWREARDGELSRSFLEIPMAVSPLRVPWLGTTVALANDVVGRAMNRAAVVGRAPVVFEVHGIDYLAPEDGAEAALTRAQRDLQIPLGDKLRRLERAMRKVVEHRRVRPLRDLARRAGFE